MQEGRPARPFIVSSFQDYSPAFSPDGRRIAFESGRSGETQEIWLADADGSNPVQLTHGPGTWQGQPRFSPDSRRVVFNSRGEDGYADVWTIDTDGGSARRITHAPRVEAMASWSHDGRWIYYREDRADGRDIWRIPDQDGCAPGRTRLPLYRLDPATGRTRLLGEVETGSGPNLGMAVAPDGKTILFAKKVAEGADLMLIENFR